MYTPNMQYITTTQLRTMTTDLIASLAAGESVDLVHRSKIVGKIEPKTTQSKPFTKKDVEDLITLARKMNLPKLSYKQRGINYRRHIMQKYGQGLSRH